MSNPIQQAIEAAAKILESDAGAETRKAAADGLRAVLASQAPCKWAPTRDVEADGESLAELLYETLTGLPWSRASDPEQYRRAVSILLQEARHRGMLSEPSALQSLQGVELPPLLPSDHPEPHTLVWSKVEIEAIQAYARTAVAAAMARGAVPQGYTLVPDAALRWLFGEEGDFVCPPDRYFRGAAPPYWWRSVFRDWIAAAPSPEATQPTQAEAPSERERFDAYWLKRQRERGFGAKLTDAEMLAHPSDQDDEFHAWCAALATQQAGQGEDAKKALRKKLSEIEAVLDAIHMHNDQHRHRATEGINLVNEADASIDAAIRAARSSEGDVA